MPAKPAIGLYFSDEFIEVSKVSMDGQNLTSFSQLSVPKGIVKNGEIKNPNVFAQLLQQLFSNAKPSSIKLNEEIVLGVSDSRVFLRVFTVPSIAGKNINDAIEYQVRSLLQVMPVGVESDWQIIGKDDDGQIEVLLAAIPREIIDSYVAVCSSVGLRVVALEPAVFANTRTIVDSQLQGKTQLLFFLGETFGTFSYLTNGNPRFSELLTLAEIDNAGGIAKAILTHVNFANSKNIRRPVQEVLVASSRPDIESLTSNLALGTTFISKAVGKLTASSLPNQSLLRTSHGLALKLLSTPSSFNILPVEYRLDVIRQRKTFVWQVVLDFLIVLTALGFLLLYYVYRSTAEKQIQLSQLKLNQEVQLKLPENQLLIKQAEDLNKISSNLITLRSLVGGEEVVYNELSSITPNGLTLTSFIIARNPASKAFTVNSSWIITGIAESRDSVLKFYADLIKFPEYKDGKLYFGSLEKDAALTFRIASKQQ